MDRKSLPPNTTVDSLLSPGARAELQKIADQQWKMRQTTTRFGEVMREALGDTRVPTGFARALKESAHPRVGTKFADAIQGTCRNRPKVQHKPSVATIRIQRRKEP